MIKCASCTPLFVDGYTQEEAAKANENRILQIARHKIKHNYQPMEDGTMAMVSYLYIAGEEYDLKYQEEIEKIFEEEIFYE